MIKICDNSLVRPLSLLFKKSFDNSCFPELWKKSNIIPVHKKMKNSILKIIAPFDCCKVFEKIIFNKIDAFLQNEQLLSRSQSGFRSSDSCTNQLPQSNTKFSSLLTPHRHSKLD